MAQWTSTFTSWHLLPTAAAISLYLVTSSMPYWTNQATKFLLKLAKRCTALHVYRHRPQFSMLAWKNQCTHNTIPWTQLLFCHCFRSKWCHLAATAVAVVWSGGGTCWWAWPAPWSWELLWQPSSTCTDQQRGESWSECSLYLPPAWRI